jgi:uncharacterized FlgJ-related protein
MEKRENRIRNIVKILFEIWKSFQFYSIHCYGNECCYCCSGEMFQKLKSGEIVKELYVAKPQKYIRNEKKRVKRGKKWING